MTEDIKEFIRMCDRCQRKKTIQLQKNRMTMKSIPIPQKIFSQIGIDLVTMVESQGYKCILTICNFFTKWPELIPICYKKATTIAKNCMCCSPDMVVRMLSFLIVELSFVMPCLKQSSHICMWNTEYLHHITHRPTVSIFSNYHIYSNRLN